MVFSVAARTGLYNGIFWYSDPCYAFLRNRASVPATAGVLCGVFNLRRERELQGSPKNRAEKLLLL